MVVQVVGDTPIQQVQRAQAELMDRVVGILVLRLGVVDRELLLYRLSLGQQLPTLEAEGVGQTQSQKVRGVLEVAERAHVTRQLLRQRQE